MVRKNVAVAKLPAPPTVFDLSRIRVELIPKTFLVCLSAEMSDPLRDTAILNAALDEVLAARANDLRPGQLTLISRARAGRNAAPRLHRVAQLAYSLFVVVLVLGLMAFAIRVSRAPRESAFTPASSPL